MSFIKTMPPIAHTMTSTILHKELTIIVLFVLLIFKSLNMALLLIYVRTPVIHTELT